MSNFTEQEIQEKSILLIGPIGAGKSSIAKHLANDLGLPMISIDVLKHAESLSSIEIEQVEAQTNLKKYIAKRDQITDSEFLEKINAEIRYFEDHVEFLKNQHNMRSLLPNFPNLREFGYKANNKSYLKNTYGVMTALCYRLYFDAKYSIALLKNLPCPCVVDFGGLSSVFFDDIYSQICSEIKEKDDYDLKYFGKDINFDMLKQAFDKFSHKYCVELSENYKETNKTAKQFSIVNDIIIASKQNEEIANKIVDSTGIVDEKSFHEGRVKSIAKDIEFDYSKSFENNLKK